MFRLCCTLSGSRGARLSCSVWSPASLLRLLPPALFWVSKLIIDTIFRILTTHQPAGPRLWWLVAAEFAMAVATGVLGRVIDYLDALLAGKYTHHVSVRVMEHAASLDLMAYEDPVFYDRLERARVQATDRLYMIQAIGRLIQQVITTITLSVSIMVFSPWLLLMLIVGVIPAFVGETHFAFLGYAKNFRQTPIRRQLDYLRILGGSKEAAKELKLFGLREFLTGRFRGLSTQVYEEDVALARKKVAVGAVLSAIGTAGYYTAYVFAVWRTVTGVFSFGTLTFLGQRHSRGQFEPAANFFNALDHRRSGFVPDRPDRVFRDAPHDPIEAQRSAGAAANPARI